MWDGYYDLMLFCCGLILTVAATLSYCLSHRGDLLPSFPQECDLPSATSFYHSVYVRKAESLNIVSTAHESKDRESSVWVL